MTNVMPWFRQMIFKYLPGNQFDADMNYDILIAKGKGPVYKPLTLALFTCHMCTVYTGIVCIAQQAWIPGYCSFDLTD